MTANTLYYTFSAMPQVLGAIAAVIAAFVHFRIANLREYLVGDGHSVLNRLNDGEDGYRFQTAEEQTKQHKRLRDAVDRRSIPEIKHVIFLLQEIEKNEGFSKKTRPTGLQYLYEDRFCGTEERIRQLKKLTMFVIAVSFLTIIGSIVSLAMTDKFLSAARSGLASLILWLNVGLFIASLFFNLGLLGLSEITVMHESDRKTIKVPGQNGSSLSWWRTTAAALKLIRETPNKSIQRIFTRGQKRATGKNR